MLATLVPATSNASRATYDKYLTGKKPDRLQGETPMLWTIFVILLILWLLGFVGFHVLGAYIHILLIIAVVVLIFAIIGGRRSAL
jgi:asparagine N-glycosylation enzyme membrane subunit Stt3